MPIRALKEIQVWWLQLIGGIIITPLIGIAGALIAGFIAQAIVTGCAAPSADTNFCVCW
jgi:uncharacterized membrane protein YeaQ/YmgE (transglycosylase-associated protein family)